MEYLTAWYWNRGNFRAKNEDSFSLQKVRIDGRQAAFLLVCDGIGGLPEGETASGFVTEAMTEWFYREGIRLMGSAGWKKRAAAAAGSALARSQEQLERCEREEGICCGTTCTMALVKGRDFALIHSGDSRAYRIGRKEQLLTRDHKRDGMLCRCIGAFGFEEPDVLFGRLRPGDLLVLCSDGFSGMLPEGFLISGLSGEEAKAGTYFKRLKGMGSFIMAQGEKDNLTALALRCCRKGGRG